MSHLKSHDASYTVQFQCDVCDYKGVSNWNLKRHKYRQHRDMAEVISAASFNSICKVSASPSQPNVNKTYVNNETHNDDNKISVGWRQEDTNNMNKWFKE